MDFSVGLVLGFLIGAWVVVSSVDEPITIKEIDKCQEQGGTSILILSNYTFNCYTPAGKLEMERK